MSTTAIVCIICVSALAGVGTYLFLKPSKTAKPEPVPEPAPMPVTKKDVTKAHHTPGWDLPDDKFTAPPRRAATQKGGTRKRQPAAAQPGSFGRRAAVRQDETRDTSGDLLNPFNITSPLSPFNPIGLVNPDSPLSLFPRDEKPMEEGDHHRHSHTGDAGTGSYQPEPAAEQGHHHEDVSVHHTVPDTTPSYEPPAQTYEAPTPTYDPPSIDTSSPSFD